MKKERIDKLLHDRGLADSRTKAQALIMAGVVLVDERRIEKASEAVSPEANIRIKGDSDATRFVGRGGLKLEHALDQFHIRVDDYVCIDVGSSTGGFTDCLLQRGAAKVYAVDAGTNQLAWKLRSSDRVIVRENTNARHLAAADFDEPADLIVIDVSFISIKMILPVLPPLLKPTGRVVALIKPQFEVGKGEVGKGGIVREPEKHTRVIAEVNAAAAECGLTVAETIESPITGAEGNKEFLALYVKA